MSWIDSESVEEVVTDATIDKLMQVLELNGYKICKTKMQITATKSSFWTSKSSFITIIDKGDYRLCKDKETAKGHMVKPSTGILAKIVNQAEED